MKNTENKWPKIIPPLSEEKRAIRDDFMHYWLSVLPKKYGIVEKYNHGYSAKKGFFDGCRTLEIGAGLGEHLAYENLAEQEYSVIELRSELAEKIKIKYPDISVIVGDCSEHIDVDDSKFDRILAIHVLEHLPNLPACLNEIYRILSDTGKLVVVIPCEGGLAYGLARKISAQRIFERRYHQSYDWFIAVEHINRPNEIIEELIKRFSIEETSYYPLIIPSVTMNLCIGMVLTKK